MSDTRRIARNTLMLYFRQILIMAVSLYTVREVLNVLGAEDYGIYNVMAGVVVLFSFLNGSMTLATQRYMNCAMGKNNIVEIKVIFKSSFILHFFVASIVLLLAETVGLWFVKSKLNIPENRNYAAFICYQISILTAIFNILRVPFHATVIAYEQMEFFAFVSIVESILKLLIIFVLGLVNVDKLIFYSVLMMSVVLIVNGIYLIYCCNKYESVDFSCTTNLKTVRELSSYSGWTLLTGFADMCKAQGTNIIFNIFYGVIVNAAMGIANQINSAIYMFVSNFQTAYTPQIIKSYSANENQAFRKLVFQSIKISFILFSIIVIPFSVNAEKVIGIWLGNIPDYTLYFTYFILLDSLIGTFIGPLASAMQGIGKIRTYQIVISIFIFLNLPISYLLIRFGFSPKYALLMRVILSFVALFWRLFYLKGYLNLNLLNFFFSIIFLGLLIDFISLLVGIGIKKILTNYSVVLSFLSSCFFSASLVCLLSFLFLLKNDEKKVFVNIIKSKLRGSK